MFFSFFFYFFFFEVVTREFFSEFEIPFNCKRIQSSCEWKDELRRLFVGKRSQIEDDIKEGSIFSLNCQCPFLLTTSFVEEEIDLIRINWLESINKSHEWEFLRTPLSKVYLSSSLRLLFRYWIPTNLPLKWRISTEEIKKNSMKLKKKWKEFIKHVGRILENCRKILYGKNQ